MTNTGEFHLRIFEFVTTYGSRKHNTEKEHMYTDIQNQCVCMAGVILQCEKTELTEMDNVWLTSNINSYVLFIIH